MTKVTEHLHTLFLSCLLYLHSIDQIHNLDKILTSFLTNLTSTRKGLDIGGPTTLWHSSTTGSFLFFQTKLYKQLLPSIRKYTVTPSVITLHISPPLQANPYTTSLELQNMLLFSRKFSSAYGVNTLLWGLHWWVHCPFQRLLISSQKDLYLMSIRAVVFTLEYFSYVKPPPIFVFPLTDRNMHPSISSLRNF